MRDAEMPPGPAARRKRRPAAEIMDRLIGAAGAEFAEHGYAAATTAAIARRAEVTEAQLFRYFPSKADLFREAVFKPLEQHIARFTEHYLADAEDAAVDRARALQYTAELQAFLRRHGRLLMAFLAAHAFGPRNGPQSPIDSLDAYFERGAATWAARMGRSSPVDPRLMVRVSFAAVLGNVIMQDWLFPPGLASEAEIDRALGQFMLHGIAPPAEG